MPKQTVINPNFATNETSSARFMIMIVPRPRSAKKNNCVFIFIDFLLLYQLDLFKAYVTTQLFRVAAYPGCCKSLSYDPALVV